MREEVYVSTDIEADGPIPGQNSMLSIASAAFSFDKRLLGTFSRNLELLDGAVAEPQTMAFWANHPEAYAACREDVTPIRAAMLDYVIWLEELPGPLVFASYPVAYDFMWVYWYLMRFVGKCPFSHSGLDIKTLAMALTSQPYRMSTKRNMPTRWFDAKPHTHVALDDALEQGALLCNMLAELSGRTP